MLDRASEQELVTRCRAGEEAARDELIRRYLPLARRLAGRYRHSSESIEDLIAVANLGLVTAVERFDPDRGAHLSSYAVPTIVGELKRHFRDRGWAVHMPRRLQDRAAEVTAAIDRLGDELGRSPSVGEVAGRLEIGVEEALEAIEAAQAYASVPLDSAESDEEGLATADALGAEDPRYELVEYGASVAGALAEMDDRDRRVLHLRFVEDLTQSEIAARVGVSQMQVSRIIRRAVAALRESVAEPAA